MQEAVGLCMHVCVKLSKTGYLTVFMMDVHDVDKNHSYVKYPKCTLPAALPVHGPCHPTPACHVRYMRENMNKVCGTAPHTHTMIGSLESWQNTATARIFRPDQISLLFVCLRALYMVNTKKSARQHKF